MGLALFTQHNYLKIHPNCCIYKYFIFLLLSNIPGYGYITVCLTIHFLKDICFRVSWLLWLKQLWAFVCTFLCNISFHFFVINAQEGSWGFYGNRMFSFMRWCRTIFQSGCNILHPHCQSLSDPISLHHLLHFYVIIFFILAILIIL